MARLGVVGRVERWGDKDRKDRILQGRGRMSRGEWILLRVRLQLGGEM
jgi:hypothetical protein